MNKKKLEVVFESYIEWLEMGYSDERHKWEAVSSFSKYWDLNRNDLEKMIDESFQKAGNLLTTQGNLPLESLKFVAKNDPAFLENYLMSCLKQQTITGLME